MANYLKRLVYIMNKLSSERYDELWQNYENEIWDINFAYLEPKIAEKISIFILLSKRCKIFIPRCIFKKIFIHSMRKISSERYFVYIDKVIVYLPREYKITKEHLPIYCESDVKLWIQSICERIEITNITPDNKYICSSLNSGTYSSDCDNLCDYTNSRQIKKDSEYNLYDGYYL